MTKTGYGSDMEEAIVAALTEDVLEGGRVVVDIEGVEIGIFRLDGRLYAWENQLRSCRRPRMPGHAYEPCHRAAR